MNSSFAVVLGANIVSSSVNFPFQEIHKKFLLLAFMKAVCYILTVYFLSLTGLPCADNVTHSVEKKTPCLSISDADGSSGHTGAGDDCSLMCACHCCHVHVVIVPPVKPGLSECTSADYIDPNHRLENTVVSPFLRPPIA